MIKNLFKTCVLFEKLCIAEEENPFILKDDNPIYSSEEIAKLSKFNSKLNNDFWIKFIEMCKRLQVKPQELASVLRNESRFDPQAVNYVTDPKTNKHKINPNRPLNDRHHGKIPQAKGLNQLIKSTAKSLGMTDEEWENYDLESAEDQLKWVEKYFERNPIKGLSRGDIYVKNFGGYHNKQNGIMYASQKYMNAHSEINWQNQQNQNKAYEQNKALDKDNKGYITVTDLKKTVGAA